MRFVIVTGMSGAGKSTALKILEDVGYFCADNLPIPLVEKFAELACASDSKYDKVALGVDIRNGEAIRGMQEVLEQLMIRGISYEVLYLDASEPALLRRYKETRRSHPLARNGRVDEGIRMERAAIGFLKERADYIIDTSNLLTRELRGEMEKIFVNSKEFRNIFVTVLSFGFKYGIPADCDLVFDVRLRGGRQKSACDRDWLHRRPAPLSDAGRAALPLFKPPRRVRAEDRAPGYPELTAEGGDADVIFIRGKRRAFFA